MSRSGRTSQGSASASLANGWASAAGIASSRSGRDTSNATAVENFGFGLGSAAAALLEIAQASIASAPASAQKAAPFRVCLDVRIIDPLFIGVRLALLE
jgi:hypothetical protein